MRVYILSGDPHGAAHALSRFRVELPVPVGPTHEVPVGGLTLSWAAAEVDQNLHRFTDGAYLGLLRADEPTSTVPIAHDGPLPGAFDPLLPGVVVRARPCSVEPQGVRAAYFGGGAVADRQLLLAAHLDVRPSVEGIALLASVGYLPGNLTLFAELSRVPLLHRLDPVAGTTTAVRTLALPRADDDALVERLRSIVPSSGEHALGLSGGVDSRFVLGILRGSAPHLRAIRFESGVEGEGEIAAQVARQAGVDLEVLTRIGDPDFTRPAAIQVLLGDAQLYGGVPQWAQVRAALSPATLFHSGHFADSIIKNAFKSAWKAPDPRQDLWTRLIERSLLSGAPARHATLRDAPDREELVRSLTASLAGLRGYVDFSARRQWANWFYFANRGTRWAQGLFADVAFEARPVFLLADLDAQLLGIASGFWDNFANDRAKRLNRGLLPEVTATYAGGSSLEPGRGPRGALHKLTYEYGDRLVARRTGRARTRAQQPRYTSMLPEREPEGWDQLFVLPMAEASTSGTVGARRTALTATHVLGFLERARRSRPPTGGATPST